MPVEQDLVSLRRELDTDWIPDPWAWSRMDLLPRELESSRLSSLEVPLLGGRSRCVPLLPGEWRLGLQGAVRQVMSLKDPILSEGVLAYRMRPDGSIGHYREALRERRIRNASLAKDSAVVALTDIASFFPSSQPEIIRTLVDDAPGADALLDIIGHLHERYGYVLPEGYSAARCLANLYLLPIDSVITKPFTRWVDDYVMFCEDDFAANRILTLIDKTANEQGLQLSSMKTTITWSRNLDSSLTSSVSGVDQMNYQDLLCTFPELLSNNDRLARLLLHLAVERKDESPLKTFVDAQPEEVPATLMPRLAWFLASIPWTDKSTALIKRLLAYEDPWSAWRAARLIPALWFAPQCAAVACREYLVAAVDNQNPGAGIAGRVMAKHLPNELEEKIDSFQETREHVLLNTELRSPSTCNLPSPTITSFL